MPNLREPNLPESDVAQFIGMNLDPLIGLATFITVSEGFTLGFAEVNFASDVERLLVALRQRLESEAVQLEVLRLTNPKLRYLLEELKQVLPTIQVEPGKKLVLILCGLEQAIGVIGEYPPILADLNFVRDILAKQVPHPMVFVLPDYALTRIARYANDFWAWSSGVFVFRTAQQTLDTVHTQILQGDRLYSSDAKPVKQERIDLLQRLLMEYESAEREGKPSQAQNRLNILLELGNAYCSLADYRRAELFYQKALVLARNTGENLWEANALKAIGDVLRFLDRRNDALDNYQQAVEIYRVVGDLLGEANTLLGIGDTLQFLDRHNDALDNYQQAVKIYRAIGHLLGEANTLHAIGTVLQFSKLSIEALENYKQAIDLYQAIGDRVGTANTLYSIGNVLQFLTRSNEALEHYQQAITIYRSVGDQLGKANTLKAIGDVLKFLKRSNEAVESYQEALEIYQAISSFLGEANTLKAIGDLLQFLKRGSEAMGKYNQAIEIYRSVDNRIGEANTLKAIGDVLKSLDRHSEALENYDQAIEIYRSVGARLGEANVLRELGKLQENLKDGLAYLQQAQKIYEQIGDQYSQSRNLLFIADLYIQLQSIDKAVENLQKSAALANTIGYEPIRDYALNKISELQQPISPQEQQ